MLKKSLIFVFIFFLGFVTHAIFFPDVLLEQLTSGGKQIVGIEKKTPEQKIEPLIRTVSYTIHGFSPKAVVIRYGNYIAIKNTSKGTLMSLTSTHKSLGTKRGYGEGEVQQVAMNTEGTFTVQDDMSPPHTLTVIVKK